MRASKTCVCAITVGDIANIAMGTLDNANQCVSKMLVWVPLVYVSNSTGKSHFENRSTNRVMEFAMATRMGIVAEAGKGYPPLPKMPIPSRIRGQDDLRLPRTLASKKQCIEFRNTTNRHNQDDRKKT